MCERARVYSYRRINVNRLLSKDKSALALFYLTSLSSKTLSSWALIRDTVVG